MGSIGIPIPNPSPPFYPFTDCSRQFCTAFCPQFCPLIFSPPPPLFGLDDTDSSTYFSPLIVAIIGILASAFILITYYALVSKYCRRRTDGDSDAGIGFNENLETDRVINETRRSNSGSGSSPGLDEGLIKSISVFKYKESDGLVEGNDCSVCLSEFEENESLRLLPKCNHAFHLHCIDAWLKTNSSCPLCRCNIASVNEPAPPVSTAREYRRGGEVSVVVVHDLPDDVSQEAVVVEIVGEGVPGRSDGGEEREIGIGSSNGEGKEDGKFINRNGIFDLGLKKSISSGIFVFSRNGR